MWRRGSRRAGTLVTRFHNALRAHVIGSLKNSLRRPMVQISHHPLFNLEVTVIHLVTTTTQPDAATSAPGREELLALIPSQRISDSIRLRWGSGACDEFLNSLLINDRVGDRQGFAPSVAHAIFALITLNEFTRRRIDSPAKKHAASDENWANETGRWEIIKSREHKEPTQATPVAQYPPHRMTSR